MFPLRIHQVVRCGKDNRSIVDTNTFSNNDWGVQRKFHLTNKRESSDRKVFFITLSFYFSYLCTFVYISAFFIQIFTNSVSISQFLQRKQTLTPGLNKR